MSFSSNTLRALSRPQISSFPKTLLPFLYQTATIQQTRPRNLPIALRHVSSRAALDTSEDIPFESPGVQPTNVSGALDAPSRKSTVTGPERAAFHKLYQKIGADPQPRDDVPFVQDSDQIFDEYYEEEEDQDGESASLDALFDAVISGLPPPQAGLRSGKRPPRMENLQTLAEDILKGEVAEAKKKPKLDKAVEAARVRQARLKERARINTLMDEAKTDMEVWDILQREVFERIREMNLDAPQSPNQNNKSITHSKSAKKGGNDKQTQPAEVVGKDEKATAAPTSKNDNTGLPKPQLSDPRILFPNYPLHLLHALDLLRTHFPSSSLPLTLLPAMKALGRSSYALGATTPLYNTLLRTAWLQYSSYTHICDLLTDMDNGGIEFNSETLGILSEVLEEEKNIKRGVYGERMKWVSNMDALTKEVQKVREWKAVVGQRLGSRATRRASGRKVHRPNILGGNAAVSGLGNVVGAGAAKHGAALLTRQMQVMYR